MIDKLDLRIPHFTEFAPSFGRIYRELRALEKGPFHPSKYYGYAGDLREYGHNVRLNLYCMMDPSCFADAEAFFAELDRRRGNT